MKKRLQKAKQYGLWLNNGLPTSINLSQVQEKQYEVKKLYTIWSVGYQNRVKRLCGVYFGIFEDFCFKFLEKSQILRPFSSLAPSKLKMCSKN